MTEQTGNNKPNEAEALAFTLSVPAFKGGPDAVLIYDILSPDCRDGKCAACTGDAWNDTTDQGCACECACHDTKEGE